MQTNPTHSPTHAHRDSEAVGSSPRTGEHYEVLGELATGGMATVYLGRLRRAMGFSRLVAIKCMHPQYAKDPSFASMFVDEARLTARLRHPNVVPTLDIVNEGGQLLIVMEYVEGESLAGLLRLVQDAGDRIPVPVACAIIHDLLLGLHEAHEARDDDGAALAIIHRDVSPQNVIVGLDGLARVLDFGVAKARSRVHHSSEGEIKGKLPYMPPEQLFGEELDRRVDVYGAGVLLWESLVGRRLFEGANEAAIVRRIDAGDVAAPSTLVSGISPELDALVMRALSTDPNGRFPTALAMAEALSSIVALPPRTTISAWVKRFARPRAVPATALGSPRDVAEASGVSAAAIARVLDRVTEPSERHSRPSLIPVTSEHTGAVRPPPRAPSRLMMGLGVVAFALAGVFVGRTMREVNAQAAPAHHESAAAAAQAVDLGTAAPPAQAPAAQTAETAEIATTAEPDDKAPAPVAPAKARGRRAKSLKTTNAPAPAVVQGAQPKVETERPAADGTTTDAKRSSCRLPYTVDAEGHRHYKVECL